MIRGRPRLTAAAARARRRPRSRRNRASTSIADAKAAPSGVIDRPPLEPPLSAGRAAEGRETQVRRSEAPAGADRPTPTRTGCRSGCDDTRGATGLCSRSGWGAARSREADTGAGSLPRSSSPPATTAGASAGAADRRPERTEAGSARPRPVFTSAGCAASPAGATGRAAAGSAGTTAGAGATAGSGCAPVAGGPTDATSAPGRSRSGSTYPFGSELRRTPR